MFRASQNPKTMSQTTRGYPMSPTINDLPRNSLDRDYPPSIQRLYTATVFHQYTLTKCIEQTDSYMYPPPLQKKKEKRKEVCFQGGKVIKFNVPGVDCEILTMSVSSPHNP